MTVLRRLATLVAPLAVGLLVLTSTLSSAPSASAISPTATPPGRIATEEELATAQSEWLSSAHSDTFDMGVGANTTCARCKSPTNWDPLAPGLEASLDCYSCKRSPGEPRPDLLNGVVVDQETWNDVSCEICHVPVGDSYQTEIAFWDQITGTYKPVDSVMELCSHCHEGQHGFEVIEEQNASALHTGWECTECHGVHGNPSSCEDCHDPEEGAGASEHARHPSVDCTGCHDAGGLMIRQEHNIASTHFEKYIPVRFAHSLTSWPSHNLSTDINCVRCHHPLPTGGSPIDPSTECTACHEDGAMWLWCEGFPRDPDPAYGGQGYESH